MRALLLILALVLPLVAAGPAQGQGAAAAYQEARSELLELVEDGQRNRYRDAWERVIAKLDAATAKLPAGDLRCGAFFNQGRAWDELSRISFSTSDRKRALEAYRQVADRCPRSSLADDALFRAGEIFMGRDSALARSLFRDLLQRFPKGDMAPLARERLAELGSQPGPSSPPAVAAASPLRESAQRTSERQANAASTSAGTVRSQEAAKANPPAPTRPPPAAAPADPSIPGSQLPSAVELLAALEAQDGHAHGAATPAMQRKAVDAIEGAIGGELPLSLVAGLKVKRVVIDPGHGGKDTGAIGPGGVKEKDLTLKMAKQLRVELEKLGLEVFLTRETDVYLALEERTRIANARNADLFVSVHVNAAHNHKAHGIETYTLNLNSDSYASRLAARENATSSRNIGDLHLILADLATKANTDDSIRLARMVQSGMVGTLRPKYGGEIRDLGVKQALFHVLVGAKMPAILVETGFISHKEEVKRLRSASYQEQLVRGMAQGVRRFVEERESFATRGDAVPTSAVF